MEESSGKEHHGLRMLKGPASNTLQHTATLATHCQYTGNTLATHCDTYTATHCNALQGSATHYSTHSNILQHTATHWQHTGNTLVTLFNTLATYCKTRAEHWQNTGNTQQHKGNTRQHTGNTLATHCNTLNSDLTAIRAPTLPNLIWDNPTSPDMQQFAARSLCHRYRVPK